MEQFAPAGWSAMLWIRSLVAWPTVKFAIGAACSMPALHDAVLLSFKVDNPSDLQRSLSSQKPCDSHDSLQHAHELR